MCSGAIKELALGIALLGELCQSLILNNSAILSWLFSWNKLTSAKGLLLEHLSGCGDDSVTQNSLSWRRFIFFSLPVTEFELLLNKGLHGVVRSRES